MDTSDANLAERLKQFREEYITLTEINRSYEIMFVQLKEFYSGIKDKVYKYTQILVKQKDSLSKALEQERLECQNKLKYLNDKINDLTAEYDECFVKNQNLKRTIKEQESKISELEKELESLKFKIIEQETIIKATTETIKLQTNKEQMQNELNTTLETSQDIYNSTKSNANENQNHNEDQNISLERKEYLDRLQFLEKVHKEESEKQEKEIHRLQNLLKQKPKASIKSKCYSDGNRSRYPDLSEFIQKKAHPIEYSKRRKLHSIDNDDIVDL